MIVPVLTRAVNSKLSPHLQGADRCALLQTLNTDDQIDDDENDNEVVDYSYAF